MWSRETKIRRDRFGVWFDGEEPIDQPAIARAFDRWLELADDGRFCLKNSVNWAYVQIEGAPVFVRQAHRRVEGFALDLSDGRQEDLDPATLAIDAEGAIHCRVRGGTLWARFDHPAALSLGEAVVEDEGALWLMLSGVRWPFALGLSIGK
ncbi:MAG: DUF1285 domain-containing protein [Myxococcota bacterium]